MLSTKYAVTLYWLSSNWIENQIALLFAAIGSRNFTYLASQVAQWVKNLPAVQEMQETRVQSLGQEEPLEESMATHSSDLGWKIPWTEEPNGLCFRGVHKSWTWLKRLSVHACTSPTLPNLILTAIVWINSRIKFRI